MDPKPTDVMDPRPTNDVDARIAQLETQVRQLWLAIAAVAAFALLVGVVLFWPGVGRITAEGVLLSDRAPDAIRMELSAGAARPGLTLSGAGGETAILTVSPNAVGLMLEHPDRPDVSLLTGVQPYLLFGDAGARGVALFGIDPTAGPRAHLKSDSGIWIAQPNPRDDGSRMVVRDGSGAVVWRPSR